MIEIYKKNKWLLLILLAALAIRLAYFINVKPWERNYETGTEGFGDALEYQMLAGKILENGHYPENYFLDTYRTPGFPIYIALIYFLFGAKTHYVLFSYILLSVGTAFIIYLISLKLFDKKKIALLASALFSFEPNVLKLTSEFGTETLHAFFLVLSCYFFVSALKDKKIIFLASSAVLFAVTALIRPVSLYFYLICLAFILLYPGNRFLYKIKTAILFGIIYFAAISPWMYRNYSTYGHFSTNAFQGTAMYFNAIIVRAYVTGIPQDSSIVLTVNDVNKICEEKKLTNPFDVDREKEIYGYNYIKEHFGVYLKLHLKGMMNYFAAPLNNERYSVISKIFLWPYMMLVYFLGIYGLVKMLKMKDYYFAAFMFITVFYFWLVTGILGLARYRLPATPFFLLLSAFGIFQMYEYIRVKTTNKKI